MKSDSEIQEDVIREIKWDPSVTHENIGVAVSCGIVTLMGAVPTYIEKMAAEKAAQRVPDVKAVVEKIEVKLPGTYERDDQDVAKAIVTQFRWNVQIPDESVKARVEHGYVKLSGEVEWEYQKVAAEECIRTLVGVKNVSNNIVIKSKDTQTSHPYHADLSSHISLQ
jgi:osmotically-inducible protein OsmY